MAPLELMLILLSILVLKRNISKVIRSTYGCRWCFESCLLIISLNLTFQIKGILFVFWQETYANHSADLMALFGVKSQRTRTFMQTKMFSSSSA